jgi:hypothetical protein
LRVERDTVILVQPNGLETKGTISLFKADKGDHCRITIYRRLEQKGRVRLAPRRHTSLEPPGGLGWLRLTEGRPKAGASTPMTTTSDSMSATLVRFSFASRAVTGGQATGVPVQIRHASGPAPMFGLILVLIAQTKSAANPTPPSDLTPRTRAILQRLEEPISMEFPKEVPLEDVLVHFRRSLRKGLDEPAIPIHIDVHAIERTGRTMTSPVRLNEKAIAAKCALTRALVPLGWAYIVKDDVLIISDPQGIERERRERAVRACDASPASQALIARLEEPVRIPFPNETPLEDVLAYLQRATARSPDVPPIKVLLVPDGLREVRQSLASPIQADLEGVPLKTTLRLLLDQLGLGCVVKEGRLVIHSRQGISKLIRAAEKR